MSKERRKGERDGKKLTPGERAINWAKAIAIIVPLFGAGWFANTETAKSLVTQQTPIERSEPVPVDCPDVSCPTCPDVSFTCPNLNQIQSIISRQCAMSKHEKEYHQ